jgi:hypothetical protein
LYNRHGPLIYPSFIKLESLKIQLAKTLNHITLLIGCKSQGIILKGYHVKTPSIVNALPNCPTCQSGTSQGWEDALSLALKRISTPEDPTTGEFSQVICE